MKNDPYSVQGLSARQVDGPLVDRVTLSQLLAEIHKILAQCEAEACNILTKISGPIPTNAAEQMKRSETPSLREMAQDIGNTANRIRDCLLAIRSDIS